MSFAERQRDDAGVEALPAAVKVQANDMAVALAAGKSRRARGQTRPRSSETRLTCYSARLRPPAMAGD